MQIIVLSFGFSRGPAEAEYLFDLRFLPNPYRVPELKPFPGTEARVAAYVLEQPETREFLALLKPLLTLVCAGCARGGREELRLAFGCTGGYHRSVAIAEHVAAWLAEQGRPCECRHRELDGARTGPGAA